MTSEEGQEKMSDGVTAWQEDYGVARDEEEQEQDVQIMSKLLFSLTDDGQFLWNAVTVFTLCSNDYFLWMMIPRETNVMWPKGRMKLGTAHLSCLLLKKQDIAQSSHTQHRKRKPLVRVELCPSKLEILIPSISECNLIWWWGIYRANQAKMRSLEWVLI